MCCFSHEGNQHLIIRLASIRLLFFPHHSHFIRLVLALLISSRPNSSPSRFCLLFSLFFSHAHSTPQPPHTSRCLSPLPLPTKALRLTTLFLFKIKIIKSAAKMRETALLASPWQHFDVLFLRDSINIRLSGPNYYCTIAHTCTIHALSHLTLHLLPPTTSSHSYCTHKDRFDTLSSSVFGPFLLSSNHSILYCWSHPLPLLSFLPSHF